MNKNHYNKSLFWCWFLFFQIVAFQSWAFSGKYPIRNFTPLDYKAGIQNIDFAQNRDMTLFVANNLGVLSYNGNDWQIHHFNTSKKIRSLAFDEKMNRLYVGAQGAFGYFDKDWAYVSLDKILPENAISFDEVWDVFLYENQVYFCTFQGIFVYNGTSVSIIHHQNGFERSFQAGQKLFTQNPRGQLFEIKGKELVSTYPQNQTGQIIRGILPHTEGILIFYNSGEIEHSTLFEAKPIFNSLSQTLKGTYVNHVLHLSDSRLAISTQTAGLYLFDKRKQIIENISIEEGLQINACLNTFQDYTGNLWVGKQNGMSLIDISSPMRFINREINIQGNGYESFDVEEGTYYTTSNGVYFLKKDAAECIFLEGTEGPSYGIQRILGKLYAGHHTGLFLLEKGRASRIVTTDGLWQVKHLESNPQYAIGGMYSGLYLFKINERMELEPVGKINGFSESSRFFEEDKKGRIWVGQFYKGLYLLNLTDELTKAIVQKIPDEPNLPSIDGQIVLSKINNELYLGTRAGVFMIDQNTDQIKRADIFLNELDNQAVYLLQQDHQNNIHIYGENSVGFFKEIRPSHYQFFPSSLYQLQYSLNNDLLNISINTDDGVLFSANEGFIHYQPRLENQMQSDNPFVISRVYSKTEDKNLYTQKPFEPKPNAIEEIVVSSNAKVLQFTIESFQFNAVENQQFRYYLEGFEKDFGEWSVSAIKEYTNLNEGKYKFHVQTRNNLGSILSVQPLHLKVEPPLHRSLAAKVAYLLLGILGLFFISNFQRQRYKQKAKAVEQAKKIELAQKQQELFDVERQKEQELNQLKEEKMKGELRHTNNLLAASTMNLVVKNEFIETIKGKLQEVKRMGKNRETKQALEQIVKDINTTLKLQEDWEQFEHHFDQVHGNFLSRLRQSYPELTPNEQKLCAFLRLNLNSKDIANLMGISLRGVEVARYRLRKKLALEKGKNLSKFVLEY